MARIPYPVFEPGAAPPLLAKLPPLNAFSMLAHSAPALGGFVKMGNALLYKCALDPKIREMAIVRIAHLQEAAYEHHQHVGVCRQLGVRQEAIAALSVGSTSDVFDPRERAALALAEDLVDNVKAGESFEAAGAHFSHEELVELVLTVGYYMMVARFMETFEVDIEPEGTDGLKF